MVQYAMLKTKAIELLGGSVTATASAVGVTYQAVDKWPEELPRRIEDRVLAALWRVENKVPHPIPHDADADEATQKAAV